MRVHTDPLDLVLDDGETVEQMLAAQRASYPNVTIELDEEVGPGGHPTVVVTGPEQNVKRVLRDWGYAEQMQPGVPQSTRYGRAGIELHRA